MNFFKGQSFVVRSPDHSHIVKLAQWGDLDGYPYLALVYRDARTLKSAIAQRTFSTTEAIALFGSQCAEALAAAHEKGIVHRDIKPDNILVDGNNLPLIIDFGLARSELMRTVATKTGVVMGTPEYMAPECITGHVAGPEADVYSLGAVLFEMLNGSPPFRGSLAQIIEKKLSKKNPKLSKLFSTKNRALAVYVESLLLPLSEGRPKSCKQLSKDLLELSKTKKKKDLLQTKVVKAAFTEETKLTADESEKAATSTFRRFVWAFTFLIFLLLYFGHKYRQSLQAGDYGKRISSRNVSPTRLLRGKLQALCKDNRLPSDLSLEEIGLLAIEAKALHILQKGNESKAIGLEIGARHFLSKGNNVGALFWLIELLKRFGGQISPKNFLNLFQQAEELCWKFENNKERHSQLRRLIRVCQSLEKAMQSKVQRRALAYCEVMSYLSLPFEKTLHERSLKLLSPLIDEDGKLTNSLQLNSLYFRLLKGDNDPKMKKWAIKRVKKFRTLFPKHPKEAIQLLEAAAVCVGGYGDGIVLKSEDADYAVSYLREAQKFAANKEILDSLKIKECAFLRRANKFQEAYSCLKAIVPKTLTKELQFTYNVEAARICEKLRSFDEAFRFLRAAEKMVPPSREAYVKELRTKIKFSKRYGSIK